MRPLIVCNIMSLDGYYAGPGNNVLDLPFDEGFDAYNADRLAAADTLLLGRTTFEVLASYWPPLADDPDAPPIEREVSRRNNSIDKVVVSDTLTLDQAGPWAPTTRIIDRVDAHEQIAQLKHQPGKEILIFGSHTLWNPLLLAGLVDELHLMIGPAVLGAGTPAFEGLRVPLRLMSAHVLHGSQLVLHRYDAKPRPQGHAARICAAPS
jgi:dihydrofolate reductase